MFTWLYHRSVALIALMLLFLSCTTGEEEKCDIIGDISLYGGRNRVLVQWDGVNNDRYSLRFTFASDVVLEAGSRSSGSEYVSGIDEGVCVVRAQLLSGTQIVGERNMSVNVLGRNYEQGLARWELSECSVNLGTVQCTFSKSTPDGLYGEEFLYTDAEGKMVIQTLLYDPAAQIHEFCINGVQGTVKRRTVYMPEPKTADKYYTEYTSLYGGDSGDDLVVGKCETVDGYRGIWFDLGQATDYGSKYCGGLGTYTMKHIPMAIYAPEVDKTFFVYGGTTKESAKYLLCMVGCYDHATGMLQKPRIVTLN